MPQKNKQTHQEATELAIYSPTEVSNHLKQMSENSKQINTLARLLLQLRWDARSCSI